MTQLHTADRIETIEGRVRVSDILALLERRSAYWKNAAMANVGTDMGDAAARAGHESFRMAEILCEATGHPMPAKWGDNRSGY